jgi:hypothetical protein
MSRDIPWLNGGGLRITLLTTVGASGGHQAATSMFIEVPVRAGRLTN